ncbi:cache domain-containing protein [Psychromarinibacter sp. S121]|uniref:cache domain-containing protein n=1 Tax=Psychromarinibacter sp. S121 TaxID=3415127 RepID=UPI003C7AD997
MSQLARAHSPRIEAAFFGLLVFFIVITAVSVALAVHSKAREFEDRVENELVLQSARALSVQFNTSLEREWDSIRAVAESIGGAPKAELDDFMDAVPAAGGRIQWAGFVDVAGVVVSGSGRIWEGRDFSGRRFFREGLSGEGVGNVFETSAFSSAEVPEPAKLVNFSMPVMGEDGEIEGVLVYSVRIAWVEALLGRLSGEMGLQIAVLDQRNEFVVNTLATTGQSIPDAVKSKLQLRSFDAISLASEETADRRFAVVPSFTLQSMPSFGWDLVVALKSDGVSTALPELRNAVFVIVAFAAGFVITVIFALFRFLVWPFKRLSGDAYALAKGTIVYPVYHRSSREAETLSEALALLQTRLEVDQVKQRKSQFKIVPHSTRAG